MAPDLSAYLQDILDACIAIEDVIVEVTLDYYRLNSTSLIPSNFAFAISNFWCL